MLDHHDSIREQFEGLIGRLPRGLAYVLIFVYAVILWSAIGIGVAMILRRLLR